MYDFVAKSPCAWLLAFLILVPAAERRAAAKDEIWRQSGSAMLSRGEEDGVVISSQGVVRLARSLAKTPELDAARVWDLARLGSGAIAAATGDAGRVYVRQGEENWRVLMQVEDSQALALAVGKDGTLAVGTGPGGWVVSVRSDGTNAGKPSRPGPDVKYVWDLAYGPDGTLFAATGPQGQLWKRAPGEVSPWQLLFDSPQAHLLSVAVADDGVVYTGSDGTGLLYEIGRDGQTRVLLDAPQEEIRCLLIGPDGALYAGTASGGASTPAPRTTFRRTEGLRRRNVLRAAYLAQDAPGGGTARLQPGAAGENVVYRIERGGSAREIFRAKALVHALAWQGQRLLVGTSPEGRIYEIGEYARETTPLVALDNGQVLSLLAEPAGGVWIGCGSPGAVDRLAPGFLERGSLTSEVFDTKLASRFGTLNWRGKAPEGASVALQVRTGAVEKPDATWSEWGNVDAPIPEGRFVQWRALLAAPAGVGTPELEAVWVPYRTINLAPEIASVDVPDVSVGDGGTRRTRLDVKWDASDPNDDNLVYRLAVRKDDWPEWLPIGGEVGLSEKTYAWDTTTMPAGRYRLRVTASDRPSNAADEALERVAVSEPFVVDHEAPLIKVAIDAGGQVARIEARDALTRIVKVEASIDGGAWTACFPVDRIFDTEAETLEAPLGDLKPGTHVVVVRATDAAGNTGAGDIVFRK